MYAELKENNSKKLIKNCTHKTRNNSCKSKKLKINFNKTSWKIKQ